MTPHSGNNIKFILSEISSLESLARENQSSKEALENARNRNFSILSSRIIQLDIANDYIVINKLLSEEKRKIEIGWHEGLHEFVQQVEIYPEVNLLDNGSIMEIEAGHGSPPGLE